MGEEPSEDWIKETLAKAMLGEPAGTSGSEAVAQSTPPPATDPSPAADPTPASDAASTVDPAPTFDPAPAPDPVPLPDTAQSTTEPASTLDSASRLNSAPAPSPAPSAAAQQGAPMAAPLRFPVSMIDTAAAPIAAPRSPKVVAASATLVDIPDVDALLDLDPTGVLSADLSNSELGRVDLDEEPKGEEASFVRGLVEWVVVLVGAVLVALLLRTFLFQAFWIPSESMEVTLLKQDRVLVNKLSYRLHDVNRGDVVVFRRPDEEQAEIRDLIKRVIALPGEAVEARGNAIYIDGGKLIEPYLDPNDLINDSGPITVPDGEVFVMGDNRDESYDSRFFGTVAEDRIVGRAFVLFWPIGRIGTL